MNKVLLVLILVFVLSVLVFNVIVNEVFEVLVEMIKEYIEMCLNWVKDDDISNEELKLYVLKCVNDEFEVEGFKKVKDV